MKLYEAIAIKAHAHIRAVAKGDIGRMQRTQDCVIHRLEPLLPSGQGVNGGCIVDLGLSSCARLTITGCYHVINDDGKPDRRIDFTVSVMASLARPFEVRIKGLFATKYRLIKRELYRRFSIALNQEVQREKSNFSSSGSGNDGFLAVMITWIVIEKGKNRKRQQQEREDLARHLRARGLLSLSDKPYMLPKQERRARGIQVIKLPEDPEPGPRCDYKNRSHHVVD